MLSIWYRIIAKPFLWVHYLCAAWLVSYPSCPPFLVEIRITDYFHTVIKDKKCLLLPEHIYKSTFETTVSHSVQFME